MEEFPRFRKEGAQGYIDDDERLSKERYVKFGAVCGFIEPNHHFLAVEKKTRWVLSFSYILSLVPSS